MDEPAGRSTRSTIAFWSAFAAVVAVVLAGTLWLGRSDDGAPERVVEAGPATGTPDAGGWTRIGDAFGGRVADRVVALEGGGLLAAGYAADGTVQVWRSDDARTWHAAAVLPTGVEPGQVGEISLSSAGSRAFLATPGGFRTSADGYHWVDLGVDALGAGAVVHDVVLHDDRFVAVGSYLDGDETRPAAWISTDARTWQAAANILAPEVDGVGAGAPGALHAVATDGTTLVAVGTPTSPRSDGTWRSADGITWTPGEVPAGGATEVPAGLDDVVWADRWLAGGSVAGGGPGLWSSADATTWLPEPTEGDRSSAGRFRHLVVLDEGVVALEQVDDQHEGGVLWLRGDDGGWRLLDLPDGVPVLPARDLAAFRDGVLAVGVDVWIWSATGPAEPVPVTTTLPTTEPTLAPTAPDGPTGPPMGSVGSPAPDRPPYSPRDAVEQAIVDAVYAAFGGGPYIKGDRTRFEGDIDEAFDEAVERYPQHAEGIAAAVYEVTLLSPTEAEVVFDIIDDDVLVTATTRGRVVLLDGRWTVSQATICEMLHRGGLRCP